MLTADQEAKVQEQISKYNYNREEALQVLGFTENNVETIFPTADDESSRLLKVSEAESSKKRKTMIIAIVVIVLVVSAGAYFYFKSKK